MLTFPFYPESPLFLYSRGRKNEAREIFKELGRKTNRVIDDQLLEKVEADILTKNEENEEEETAEQYSIVDLFRAGMSDFDNFEGPETTEKGIFSKNLCE